MIKVREESIIIVIVTITANEGGDVMIFILVDKGNVIMIMIIKKNSFLLSSKDTTRSERIKGDNTSLKDEAGKRNNTTSRDDYNDNEIKIEYTNFDNDSSNPKIPTTSRKTKTRKRKSMQNL